MSRVMRGMTVGSRATTRDGVMHWATLRFANASGINGLLRGGRGGSLHEGLKDNVDVPGRGWIGGGGVGEWSIGRLGDLGGWGRRV